MAAALEAVIGIQHGPDCTCRPLDPVTVSVQPVLVNRTCPAQKDVPRNTDPIGRVIIIWPAHKGERHVLAAWGVSVLDADSGELLTTVLGLRMVIGTKNGWEGPIEVDLEQLSTADGKPLASGAAYVLNEDGTMHTGVFRYAVTEMRVADPRPSNPADGGC